METTSTLATIDEHNPGAFSFRMKITASGALFLVLPRRDPAQPRFWCVVVVKCAPGGLVDMADEAWVGKRGLRREELAETMEAIRTDVNSWLAEPSQSYLNAWITSAHPAAGDDVGTQYLQRLQQGAGVTSGSSSATASSLS